MTGTREHYNENGRPKRALSRVAIAKARSRGQNTYQCGVCGRVHAGGWNRPEPKRRWRKP